ncbi:VanZ family protein [Methylocaldum szegediense]|uniref:VanZ family protein n=1 Tax=Methylocaldum szegediense TaxID=73780 RepID=UPI00068598E8|nr:VanZ family protein [Methylocaldum szegediense]
MRSETGLRKSSLRHRNRAIASGNGAQHPLRLSRLWQGIGWLMVAVVVWLSLTPEPPHPPTSWLAWDKAQHALAYGSLMYWFRQAFLPHWRWPLFLLLLGVMLEYLQGLGGVRTSDTNDMIANGIGVFLGLALSYTRLGRLLSRVDAIVGAKRLR